MIGSLLTLTESLSLAPPPAQIPLPELRADIRLDSLVLAAEAPAPYLGESGWIIDGQLATDPKRQLLAWASRHRLCSSKRADEQCFIYVSLGVNPTFGAFLRTVKSLKQLGLCRNVFVREGVILESPGAVAASQNEMVGLDFC
jgi:hypothetical protein